MNHAPSFAIVSRQQSEHGKIFLRYESCSVICHRLVTTVREHGKIFLRYESCFVICHRLTTAVRAWWYIHQVWNMLRQLSSSNDNGQSMVIYPFGMNHAPSVEVVSWEQSEHGNISLRYKSCSVICNRLTKTVRAWWYIHQVWIMLRQLLSSHYNGQSMVIYP